MNADAPKILRALADGVSLAGVSLADAQHIEELYQVTPLPATTTITTTPPPPPTTSTVDLLRVWLAEVTYHPSVVISVEQPGYSSSDVHLLLETKVLDSNPPHEPTRVGFVEAVPLFIFDTQDLPACRRIFHDRVYGALRKLALHELDEWFRIGGVAPYDPHATSSKSTYGAIS